MIEESRRVGFVLYRSSATSAFRFSACRRTKGEAAGQEVPLQWMPPRNRFISTSFTTKFTSEEIKFPIVYRFNFKSRMCCLRMKSKIEEIKARAKTQTQTANTAFTELDNHTQRQFRFISARKSVRDRARRAHARAARILKWRTEKRKKQKKRNVSPAMRCVYNSAALLPGSSHENDDWSIWLGGTFGSGAAARRIARARFAIAITFSAG